MVMVPPMLKLRRQKLSLELAALEMKAKILGKLSEKDEKRRKEIMEELSVVF